MSRVFTIVVILALLAVVALVPRIGTEEPGLDLGDGYAYREDTLARFRLLLEDDAWSLADSPRNPQGMLEAVHEKTGLTFVLIPAGSFMMGLEGRYAFYWQQPVHNVTATAFLLSKTECTQFAWDTTDTPDQRRWRGLELPIEGVSWLDVCEWCETAGLRLPSEAEWEYACRSGQDVRLGREELRVHLRTVGKSAWTSKNSGHKVPPLYPASFAEAYEECGCRTHPSMGKAPNGWGLFDMLGNVAELCQDHYHSDYEGAPRDFHPRGVEKSFRHVRVTRGGGYRSSGFSVHPSARGRELHSYRKADVGFRPAADLPALEQPDD